MNTLHPLRNKSDHQSALAEIATLLSAAAGTADADRLAVLAVLGRLRTPQRADRRAERNRRAGSRNEDAGPHTG